MRRTSRLLGVLITVLPPAMAAGQSRVVYTLEIGGNNHADLYEAYQMPTFTSGVTSAPWPEVCPGRDVTWAVRVSVGGTHIGEAGDGLHPLGAANLVFDLEFYGPDGNLMNIGAAPLIARGDENVPSGAGFWSSINDGDAAGARGAVEGADLEANGAFSIAIHNHSGEPSQRYRLIDPAPYGPGFDIGLYPTANGRGGIDLDATHPIDHTINDPVLSGKLVGFGAGMRSYDYTAYRPGVGKLYLSDTIRAYGFGAYVDDADPLFADPLTPPVGVEEVSLFEGQINTRGLVAGTYTLRIHPSAPGTNVIHGNVVWDSETPDYGGFGSFAVRANEVYPTPEDNPGVKFFILPPGACSYPAEIVGRHVFYNQSNFDGNKVGIDPGPIAGTRNDDADAIDPTKSPLMLGGGQSTFTNWTGYNKGINGLTYDIVGPSRTPTASDFSFNKIGSAGTSAPIPIQPSGFASHEILSNYRTVTRCVFTFDSGAIKRTWLQVDIGTGFGLWQPETHFWGNAPGDTGDNAPYTPNKAIVVSSTDFDGIRTHTTAPNMVAVDNRYDVDKNARVSSTDTDCVISNPTNPGNTLKAIVK